jgi:predicted RNA-binding protein associated with RNAse of E/G family
MRRFAPGEAVALREIWRDRIWSARPATVVRDDDELALFLVPSGVRWMCPRTPAGPWLRLKREVWELDERTWDTNVLSFADPGEAHAVMLFFDEDWTARSWYVNLQEPLRRSAPGFDYLDQALDVVVSLDRSSWRWKDEDELAEEVRLGVFSEEEAVAFRAEGERAVRRLLDGEPPFDREWSSWRPDPAWPIPELPEGWDTAPVTEA